MENIQVFESPEFGQVRTTTYNGEVAFVAKDVAERLGYTWQPNVITHIPGEWRGVNRINVRSENGTEQGRDMHVLTEQGLYFFLARSDKPLALPFQKWIAGEVIPSIRKHGAYAIQPQPTGMDLVLAGYTEAMKQIEVLTQTVESQQARIAIDAPKVAFAEAFERKNVLCNLQRLANVLYSNGVDIGRQRLVDDFRKKGYISQDDALLTQKALNAGIGQNVKTGEFEYRGVTTPSFRAFLNFKGITGVFHRYGLSPAQQARCWRDLNDETT